ncbi:MAG TPA: pyrroline-5-carboxylate reductase [Candidatus Baltobacteraceae bacterium]
MDIGILGCGTLGRTLAKGLAAHPRVSRIVASTKSKRTRFEGLPDVIALEENRELASVSDVIVLCVKPAQLEAVVREIAGELRPETLLISAAASVETARIAQWTASATPIVRAMPNTPCRIGAGMTAIAAGPHALPAHLELAAELFAMLGRVCTVEERLMDAVTAMSGCGPAYGYLIVEALADAGVMLGLPRAIAVELAAQTLYGAGAMILASDAHPAALKDEVTTPAGCTIAALLAFEAGGLRSTLARGVAAAAHAARTPSYS